MSTVDTSKSENVLRATQDELNALMRGEPRLGSVGPVMPDLHSIAKAVQALKDIVETREGRKGSKVDQNITWRDLFDNGVVRLNIGGQSIGGSGGGFVDTGSMYDSTIPHAPENFSVDGAITSIIMTWGTPHYKNHSHAEVWRSATNDIGTATLNGTTTANIYVDSAGSGQTFYYWVRFISTSVPAVVGPFNATAGTMASTSQDPAELIDLLTGEGSPFFGQFPFFNVTTPTTINGVSVPVGTYMRDAFIANGTISNAKIGTAAIDDAKIANLSAAKITAGDISADRMSANIVQATSGKFSTLSALTSFLGTVEISNGGYLRTTGATSYSVGNGIWMGNDSGTYKFRVGSGTNYVAWNGTSLSIQGGVIIGNTDFLRTESALSYSTGTGIWMGYDTGTYKMRIGNPSGQYIKWDGTSLKMSGALMSGAFTSYNWPASGGTGFYLGPEGLLIGNSNDGKYFQVDANGNILAPGLQISNGNAIFSGALTANSVTTENIISSAVTASGSNTGTSTASVTISTFGSGRPVLLLASMTGVNPEGSPSSGAEEFGLTINGPGGVLIANGTVAVPSFSSNADAGLNSGRGYITIMGIHNASGGANTYTATLGYSTNGITNPSVTLVALELKR
jgi:hypothetical protein